MSEQTVSTTNATACWKANLDLTFGAAGGRTILRRVRHEGPLRVQRAFYPEADGTCHVYVLHPPGGVVQGDELAVQLRVEAGSRCLMTTPGATKIYAGNEFVSQISTKIYVESAARCEWLPQETIVFEGAQAVQQTQIDLDEAACFVGWDVACLGRPAAGEHFTRGLFCNRFTVTRAGIPLLSERLRVDGTQPMLDQAWGLRRHPAFGTLCVAVPGEQWVEALREHIESANTPDVFVVGTELDGISVFRAMGSRTEAVKRVLGALWNDCRTRMGTDGNHWPRIWAS